MCLMSSITPSFIVWLSPLRNRFRCLSKWSKSENSSVRLNNGLNFNMHRLYWLTLCILKFWLLVTLTGECGYHHPFWHFESFQWAYQIQNELDSYSECGLYILYTHLSVFLGHISLTQLKYLPFATFKLQFWLPR